MANDLMSRANRLEKLAKTARDKAGDQQEIARVKTAIESLNVAVTKLDSQLAVWRALNRVDPSGKTHLDLDAPLADLTNFIATRGRPTRQRIYASTQKVSQQVRDLEETNRTRWVAWADTELRQLEQHKIAALSTSDRAQTETRIKDLESAARRPPTSSAVLTFEYNWRQVRADLDQVVLPDPVLKVLARFESPGGVRLSDLTDEEIATLRSDSSIAAQFLIRRQS